jgi:hypothetical protein
MLSYAGTIVATKKKKMIFDNHEKFCKMSIETGKAHRIPYTYRYFMCYCMCHGQLSIGEKGLKDLKLIEN